MQATNPNKITAYPSYKPLSIEQENAIDRLMLAQTDQEVADAVGLTRPTLVGWRAQTASRFCGSSSLWVTWCGREVNHPLITPYTRVAG